MPANFVVEPVADTDTDEAYQFYESQRTGLGSQFLVELDRCIQVILATPIARPFWRLDYRRLKLNKFPHYVYYSFDAATNVVTVHSVFHPSRDPAELARRLGLP